MRSAPRKMQIAAGVLAMVDATFGHAWQPTEIASLKRLLLSAIEELVAASAGMAPR